MAPRRRRSDADPDSHFGILDDVEHAPDKKRRPRRGDDDTLDLDGIW